MHRYPTRGLLLRHVLMHMMRAAAPVHADYVGSSSAAMGCRRLPWYELLVDFSGLWS